MKLLSEKEKNNLDQYALRIVDYRRTGISLNHIIGCPINCAYCVRHFWGNFGMKEASMLCSDEEAVEMLVNHPYFLPNEIPIQLLHKATDPFLKQVKEHTFKVLQLLDEKGYKNVVMLITRMEISKEDLDFLEGLKNIKICVFFTYSGIQNQEIEPLSCMEYINNNVEVFKNRKNVKFIQYWRPIIAGWNDDEETIRKVLEYSIFFDAIVVKGLRLKKENKEYFAIKKIDLGINGLQNEKILSNKTWESIIKTYKENEYITPLFRKTSCAIAATNKLPDYNMQYLNSRGCSMCNESQHKRCESNINELDYGRIMEFERVMGKKINYTVVDGILEFEDMDYQEQIFAQHFLHRPVNILNRKDN